MYLAGPDTRRLNRIDAAVSRSAPRLAAMFAVFTKLVQDEDMPRAERVSSAYRQLLAVMSVPLLMAMTLSTVLAAAVAKVAIRGAAAIRRSSGNRSRSAAGSHVPASHE